MAVNPDTYGDSNLISGWDPDTYFPYHTVRIRIEGGVVREVIPSIRGVTVSPNLIEEKLALLKVSPVGTRINKVGWRRTQDVFYLRFYEDEFFLGALK